MRNPNARVPEPNEYITCAGDVEKTIYDTKVNPDGTITLKPSGKQNLKEYINSFRESTDISFIIARMKAGDVSALQVEDGMYGDFTKFPSTYAEVLQLYIDKENQFDKLPLDVRNKFDNDFRKWFATAGSEEWMQKMDPIVIKPEADQQGSAEIKEE